MHKEDMMEKEITKDKIINTNISNEIKNSFLDYSMSVIVSRAIPDVRDGLKPVHRRILYTMYEAGMTPDKKYQKSANAVGAVMGHYHPHGDMAIYETMVRMAQDFTYRHMLVDGHGNFGSIDGDAPAASRYTEARLAKVSMELLRELNKDTVDFMPNYDGQRKEPTVLPSRFPNILVNGNMGIAVGMATNIPPHNLGEVIDATVAYIDNPDIEVLELMEHIKGPDFPTGATILGNSGIKKAYDTGRGSITIRSKAHIEEHKGRQKIVFTEIPYQVNKTNLRTKIAELVRDKVIEGIADLNDESALEGIRLVIDVKKDANAEVVLNNIYKYTQLQTTFGINFLMLVGGRPMTLGLKDILSYYLDHQKEVIIRRTRYDLAKAEARVHILEGLRKALDNIDEIIKLIKQAKNDKEALTELMNRFSFSEIQANAILEMKLRKLTGLEQERIEAELKELKELIAKLKEILSSDANIFKVIKEEMLAIRDKFATPRMTEIDMNAIDYIEDESLIPNEEVVISITNAGYIKRTTIDNYRVQNRGGVGVKGMTTNEEDYVEQITNMKTHDYLLFFSDRGKVYRIKGYEVPEYSRQAKGLPIVNLLPIDKDEKINNMLKISPEYDCCYLLFATMNGTVKKTLIDEFNNIRKSGKIAITLKDNDQLIAVRKITDSDKVVLGSSNGRIVIFNSDEVRTMGRTASGVRGINLDADATCIGAEILSDDKEILVVTDKGYGKRTKSSEYRETKRGSKGVKGLNLTEKNGNILTLKIVDGTEKIIISTNNGVIIKLSVEQIAQSGRVTQGVRLINLKEDTLVSATSVIREEDDADLEE